MVKSGQKQGYSAQDVRQVKQVKMNLLSKEEIMALSVAEISSTKTYDPETYLPLQGGINDPRMGISNPFLRCQTCEGDILECPGHFGHLVLAEPVYHVGFIEIVKKILSCICFNCSRLRCPNEHPKLAEIEKMKDGKRRLNEMVKLCSSNSTCSFQSSNEKGNAEGCNYVQPKYKLQKLSLKITKKVQPNDDGNREPTKECVLNASKVLEIFKNISEKNVFLLGLDPKTCKPENLIIEVLPVAPPPVRPSIQMDSVSRSEDDLTHQYVSILKINLELKSNKDKNSPQSLNDKLIETLQFLVSTLFNNELAGEKQSQHKSGKPIKSIRERLKGKEGRLRKNLMGKRVDFSARSVVSPDPNLAIEQLGVPRSIAQNLTFPETVTPLNIDRMKQLVSNGPNDWPGAKFVIRNDGSKFDLRYTQNREEMQLDYGYIVERHLVDGDFVIFNRQPSLHRMSMMGHRVKILPYSSFRLNLSVTTPYNADFDGDEMNLHVPQTYETISEVRNIMFVPRNIVSPQANKPVMGIVQDTLCGIRLFTRRDSFLTKQQVMDLMLWSNKFDGHIPQPAILKPQAMWTGKQIMSLLLSETRINFEKICTTCLQYKSKSPQLISVRDGIVQIINGELLSGRLDKSMVGNASGGIIHIIWLDHGPKKAAEFLSKCQLVVNNWLVSYGFSVGCSDIFPDDECIHAVREDLQRTEYLVGNKMKLALQEDRLERQFGKNMLETFEFHLNNELNNIFKDACNTALQNLTDKNNIYNMVSAGSKGSNLNIAQIMACVGQQNVEGRRIPYGFYRRTLPHFTKDNYDPDTRGFVQGSYLSGLQPDEFFFHAMGGREGLIDTAVKTSETGYLQRRLIKALEDVMVKYDGTVRDSAGNMIQFLYGEDGMSGEYLENYSIEFLEMSNSEMVKQYRMFDPDPAKNFQEQLQFYERDLDPQVIEQMISRTDSMAILNEEFEQLMEYRQQVRKIFPNFESNVTLPVNLPRLINTIKRNHIDIGNFAEYKCKLNPINVIQNVNELVKRLSVSFGEGAVSKEQHEYSVYLISMTIKFYLSAKRVCIREKLTPEVFKLIQGEIETKFNQARVHPGEMVGIISAQSLGEPMTQMTLNTFHSAGYSAHNVTLGVPRVKEILSVGKNIKTPMMKIYLKPELQPTLEAGQKIIKQTQSEIEYTIIGHLAISSELYYDPNPQTSIIPEDVAIVENYYLMPDDTEVSAWVLRLVLDRISLIDRQITLTEVSQKIQEQISCVQVISDDTADTDTPIIRIRLKKEDIQSNEQIAVLQGIEQTLLESLRLKGLEKIRKVFLKKDRRKFENNVDGSKKEDDEQMIETDGSDLEGILSFDSVDHTRTNTNNSIEISQVLGIEAGRLSLIKEMRYVLSTYGLGVNYRHLSTLCDIMTHHGQLTSISRHGINRVVDGPLRKASFEQTVELLFQAGVFSEVQNFYGITENVMFGQLCPLGTGYFQLLINPESLKNVQYIPDLHVQNEISEVEALEFQDNNNNKNNMMIAGETPLNYRTPFYDPGANTPGGMSSRTPFIEGSFTPTQGGIYGSNQAGIHGQSPIYSSILSGIGSVGGRNQENSPNRDPNNVFSMMNKNISSPAYQVYSPIYSPSQSVTGSPSSLLYYYNQFKGYTAAQSAAALQYTPRSQIYNTSSVSPSYSQGSLQRSSGQNVYSPASAAYVQPLGSSPLYNESQSPASPKYGQSPLSQQSQTPQLSQNPGSSMYSPNSPAYQVAANATAYVPSSPVYDDVNKKEAIYSGDEDIEEEEEK